MQSTVRLYWLQLAVVAALCSGFNGTLNATTSRPEPDAASPTRTPTPVPRKRQGASGPVPHQTASTSRAVTEPGQAPTAVAAPTYYLLNQAADDFSAPPPPPTPKPSLNSQETPKGILPATIATVSPVTPKGKPAGISPSRPAHSPATTPATSASAIGTSHTSPPVHPVARVTSDTPAIKSTFEVATVRATPAEALPRSERVYTGFYQCEFGQHVLVDVDTQRLGHFKLTIGQQVVPMSPVPALAGLVRMEDASQSLVWIQLANKSMLLDHSQGQRLLDDCTVPEQMAYAQTLARTPQVGLLD